MYLTENYTIESWFSRHNLLTNKKSVLKEDSVNLNLSVADWEVAPPTIDYDWLYAGKIFIISNVIFSLKAWG